MLPGMTTAAPDIYGNVHKGIRRALFDACVALGRAGDDEPRGRTARALLHDALRFTAHHGDNEDLLLLPLLRARAPEIHDRLERAHQRMGDALQALRDDVEAAPIEALYHRACAFTSLYLEHMHEEEQQLEPAIRSVLTPDELVGFGRQSVERTSPHDQRMMLGWMLPAMTHADAQAMLARLPAPLADALRPLVDAAA